MLAGKDLAKLTLRESINLVATCLIDKSEGESGDKLNNFFKGQITMYEFEQWLESKKQPRITGEEDLDQPVTHNITQNDLDELARQREAFNNGTYSDG